MATLGQDSEMTVDTPVTSIDYTTPYDQRDEQFRLTRDNIITSGIGAHDNKTLAFINALKDYAEENESTLRAQITQQAAEIEGLMKLGQEVEESAARTEGAAADAENKVATIQAAAAEAVEEVRREEGQAKALLQLEIDSMKALVTQVTEQSNAQVKQAKEQLERSREEVATLNATLIKANQDAQQMNELKDKLQVQAESIISQKASVDSLKFALMSLSNAGLTPSNNNSPVTQRIGMFTLKPKSLSEYYGEKNTEKAYAWIEAAERVFVQRAAETLTAGSTERWGAYAIDYLKGHAAEWAHLLWPLSTNNIPGEVPSYVVDWHMFKNEFIKQHVPADAIFTLQKQLEDLTITSTIRDFNERFRLIRMRLRMATKETPPAQRAGTDAATVEANRMTRALAEAPLVNKYGLKLQKASDVEAMKGKPDGPMAHLYTEYTKWCLNNADKEPPYIPTLDKVMSYMETMDNTMNHRALTATGIGPPAPLSNPYTTPPAITTTAQQVPSTVTWGEDMMDWEASKMEQFNAMFQKAFSRIQDTRPKCHHCGKPGHLKWDCWTLHGKPGGRGGHGGNGTGGSGGNSGGSGGKKNVTARTTEVVVEKAEK